LNDIFKAHGWGVLAFKANILGGTYIDFDSMRQSRKLPSNFNELHGQFDQNPILLQAISIMRNKSQLFLALVFTTFFSKGAVAQDINSVIVESVHAMPERGRYSVKPEAGLSLMNALEIGEGFAIHPQLAQPSFCSMGTYVVFLSAIQKLVEAAEISLPANTLKRLDVPTSVESLFKDDGKNAWGRWNANGPGTARLFYLLKIGKNFTERSKRKPGDFLKIFFTEEVGMHERGHSVVYMGERKNPVTQDPEIQYWSSNQPDGYGSVWLSEKKIIHAIYSRFDQPTHLRGLDTLAEWDDYLRTLLTRPSSIDEALKMSGISRR